MRWRWLAAAPSRRHWSCVFNSSMRSLFQLKMVKRPLTRRHLRMPRRVHVLTILVTTTPNVLRMAPTSSATVCLVGRADYAMRVCFLKLYSFCCFVSDICCARVRETAHDFLFNAVCLIYTSRVLAKWVDASHSSLATHLLSISGSIF